MSKNRLYAHMLLDRSGSMEDCRAQAVGAVARASKDFARHPSPAAAAFTPAERAGARK